MKKRLFLGLLMGIALQASGCSQGPTSDPVAARVNGVEIRSSVLQRELQSRFGPEVLKDLINSEVILQEAKKQGVQISQADMDKRFAEMKANPQMKMLLEARQVDEADLKRNLTTLMHLDALIAKGISTDDEKNYLVAHRDELETVHVQSILLSEPDTAERVLKEAREPGADFAQLARENSLDPQSKDTGGDLGELRRDQMDTAVAQALFALKPGQISDVVQTPLGYYVFKLLEHKFEFKDLQKTVHDRLADEKRSEILEELRSKAKVEVVPPYRMPPETHDHHPLVSPTPGATGVPTPHGESMD